MTAPARHSDSADDDFPSVAARRRLRAALRAYLRGAPPHPEESAVLGALEELASEAHGRQLHGERTLLALKETWHELPETAALRNRRDEQRLLGRLVTLCIDVFYRQA